MSQEGSSNFDRRGFLIGTALAGLSSLIGEREAVGKTRKHFFEMSPSEKNAVFEEAKPIHDVGERIDKMSEAFLGTPYQLGSMGEGTTGDGRDIDPSWNPTGLDCTTFVEHAIAFALSKNVDEAEKNLNRIRYDHGEINYGKRRHFAEAQWIKGLTEEGFVRDATTVVGKDASLGHAEVTINASLLQKSKHKELAKKLQPSEVPHGTFKIDFVPVDQMLGEEKQLHTGMIINIVKEAQPGVLTRISHQGLVIRTEKGIMIRHASSIGAKAVLDEPLEHFVARQKSARPHTIGFNFLEVQAPKKR